jgi:hypothetical protein
MDKQAVILFQIVAASIRHVKMENALTNMEIVQVMRSVLAGIAVGIIIFLG